MDKKHLNFNLDFIDLKIDAQSKAHSSYSKETFPARKGFLSKLTLSKHDVTLTTFKKKTNINMLFVKSFCGFILLMVILLIAISALNAYAHVNNFPVKNNTLTANPQVIPDDILTDLNGLTFSCNLTDHVTAISLRPAVYDKNKLASDKSYLDILDSRIQYEKTNIHSSYIDNNSPQYVIDQYNYHVDQYNSDIQTYKVYSDNYNQEVDNYNLKVDTYNSFLKNNCKRQ